MRKTVVISGSFRKHLNDIGAALSAFKKIDIEVLAPLTSETINYMDDFVLLSTDDTKKSADILEREYMANIKKADLLYLANIDGYIGQSAAAEICVALLSGVPIIATEEIKFFSDEIPKVVRGLLKRSVLGFVSVNNISLEVIAGLNLESFLPIHFPPDERATLLVFIEKLVDNLKHK